MERREFLTLSTIAAIALLSGCGGGSSNNDSGNSGDNGGNGGSPLSKALPIPTLKTPTDIGGVKHYDLNIVKAQHTFYDNIQTNTYAIDSTYLGPTLLLKRGDNVSINYTTN